VWVLELEGAEAYPGPEHAPASSGEPEGAWVWVELLPRPPPPGGEPGGQRLWLEFDDHGEVAALLELLEACGVRARPADGPAAGSSPPANVAQWQRAGSTVAGGLELTGAVVAGGLTAAAAVAGDALLLGSDLYCRTLPGAAPAASDSGGGVVGAALVGGLGLARTASTAGAGALEAAAEAAAGVASLAASTVRSAAPAVLPLGSFGADSAMAGPASAAVTVAAGGLRATERVTEASAQATAVFAGKAANAAARAMGHSFGAGAGVAAAESVMAAGEVARAAHAAVRLHHSGTRGLVRHTAGEAAKKAARSTVTGQLGGA